MKLFLICAVVAMATASPTTRITGGSDAEPGDIPWQVSLRRVIGNGHFCGGSLISMDWVMTAAHCAVSNVNVALGSTTIDNPLQTIAGTFTINPNYDSNTVTYDYALIKLSYSATAGDTVREITLPTSDQTFTGNAIISGWGYSTTNILDNTIQTIPNDLQYAIVPLVDSETCNDAWTTLPNQERISDSMQCAGGDGATACTGDSGGPLAQEVNGVWTLIGVVSWVSSSCTTTQPAVYARIAYARQWINDTTGI